MKKSSDWLRSLNTTKKVLLGLGTLFVLAAVAGGSQPTNLSSTNTSHKSQAQSKQQSETSKAPVITTQTTTATQVIPYTSTTVQTAALAKGTTKITTTGANGSETLTYQVALTNGKQTNKQLTNTTVTLQPVTQVTSVGTYVAPAPAPAPAPAAPSCPNGTYVNSDGSTVCSPYSSSTVPAGATAQCVDGTYSFSQHRSGTCSDHGGVATWL
ncbi:MAG TPA: DUF3761 domain-containing protein [Verrucomicrobiae bacterium]|jgi:hypothetical protein|nr:DUF3761 domain-containing protein [Verrucomicrobiae bacterium]